MVVVLLLEGCAVPMGRSSSGSTISAGLSGINGVELRNSSALVIRYEDCYKVVVSSESTCLLLPLTAEGPFPKNGDASVFVLKGEGLAFDHRRKYVLGSDATEIFGKYKSGHLIIDESEKTLSLSGSLKSKNPFGNDINHSGTYRYVTGTGKVERISNSDSLRSFRGKMVKFTAYTSDSRHCLLGNVSLTLDKEVQAGLEYEFMGEMDYHGIGDELEYSLTVYRSKRVNR